MHLVTHGRTLLIVQLNANTLRQVYRGERRMLWLQQMIPIRKIGLKKLSINRMSCKSTVIKPRDKCRKSQFLQRLKMKKAKLLMVLSQIKRNPRKEECFITIPWGLLMNSNTTMIRSILPSLNLIPTPIYLMTSIKKRCSWLQNQQTTSRSQYYATKARRNSQMKKMTCPIKNRTVCTNWGRISFKRIWWLIINRDWCITRDTNSVKHWVACLCTR